MSGSNLLFPAPRLCLAALLALTLLGCLPSSPAPHKGLPEGFSQSKLEGQPERILLTWRIRGNATLRALVSLPQGQALAGLVLFPGDNGYVGIDEKGDLHGLQGNFLIRSTSQFVEQGMLTLLMDLPSDVTPESSDHYRASQIQAEDTAMAVDYIRRTWKLPVVLVGTSRGTISAANAASRLGPSGPEALVLSSSVLRNSKRGRGTVFGPKLSAISQPVLVLHNQQDGCELCPYSGVPRLLDALSGSTRKSLITLSSGGGGGAPCKAFSPHGYYGIESQATGAICTWIKELDLEPANGAQ